jgi:hypothetical protein
VLVHCYHGLGDTLHFARYLPRAARLARELTVWAQPPLIPLLRTLPGDFRLLPLHDGAPGVEREVDVEIMELAHVFRSDLATLPAEVPYLHVSPAPRPAPHDVLAVGLVWAAGDWDARRNVPPELLLPLARIPGVRLFLLQRGTALARRPPELGEPYGSDDALVAARLMRALDLVVSVDSMPAHLAGALGVPVWTLLHADADWRWLEHREDSPWYPSMRLFRQKRPGAWQPVVERVAAALRANAVGRACRHTGCAPPNSHRPCSWTELPGGEQCDSY